MRPLSILHTEASVGWGGQELRILTEARGMIDRGHQVAIGCPPEATIHDAAARYGVPVVSLPLLKLGLCAVRAVRHHLSRQRYDVVNTHSSVDSWVVALATRCFPRAPALVRTRHVTIPVNRSPGTRWLYKRASRCIVTTSEGLRRQLIASLGFHADRIVAIPTGIDPARYAPGDRISARRETGLPVDGLVTGIVATLRSGKGHRELLDAWTLLPEECGILVFVGTGPQDGALRERIETLGLGRRVRMVGNQEDVVPWLRALDLFALPSYAEGVPQALVQAQMCALPVVATPVGGILEAVEGGVTGILVPPRDHLELAQAIRSLLADPERRRALGSAARESAVGRFGLSIMLDRMEAVFESVRRGT